MKRTRERCYKETVDGGFYGTPSDASFAAENNAYVNLYWSIVKTEDGKKELKDFDDIDREEVRKNLQNLLKALSDPNSLVVAFESVKK